MSDEVSNEVVGKGMTSESRVSRKSPKGEYLTGAKIKEGFNEDLI